MLNADERRDREVVYRSRRGQDHWYIAELYGVSVSQVKEILRQQKRRELLRRLVAEKEASLRRAAKYPYWKVSEFLPRRGPC